jgi:hypothetical protein
MYCSKNAIYQSQDCQAHAGALRQVNVITCSSIQQAQRNCDNGPRRYVIDGARMAGSHRPQREKVECTGALHNWISFVDPFRDESEWNGSE